MSISAIEYRNLFISLFPALLQCARPIPELFKLILNLVYIYRALLLPVRAYQRVNEQQLQELIVQFCKNWERYFGPENALYNVHLLLHMVEQRQRTGPMTDYSCFAFESSYACIKAAQHPGTESLSKQSMYGVLSKYVCAEGTHRCKLQVALRRQAKYKTDDTLVAYGPSDFFKVTQIRENDLTGRVIRTDDFGPQLTTEMNDWRNVGVRNFRSFSLVEKTIRREAIYGKAVICGGVITSVPCNVLFDH